MVKELLKFSQPPPQTALHRSRTKNTTSLAKNRHVDLWAHTEAPNINSYTIHYEVPIFNKEGKNTHRKKSILNQHCWSKWTTACRSIQVDPKTLPKTQLQMD